jgi:hypothetical protein
MFIIGYKIFVFNTSIEIDESTRVELKDIGLTDEIISLLPTNLINSLKSNSKIVKLKHYDIDSENDEYLGTLVFEIGPPYEPPYEPPYSEEQLHDLYITFFKRTKPKLPLLKDKLKYNYNGEYSMVNSFLFIDGVSYLGKVQHIREFAAGYDKSSISKFVTYEGYLKTTFKNKSVEGNIDYEIIYESDKNRISHLK